MEMRTDHATVEMMRTNNIFRVMILLALGFSLVGCVNLEPKVDTTQFYLLDVPLNTEVPMEKAAHIQEARAIRVSRVRLMDYLDRPEIIIRRGTSQVDRQPTQRWAGDLGDNLQNELRRWWSVRQPGRMVYFSPWDTPASSDTLGLSLRISRLEGQIATEGHAQAVVALEWQWKVSRTLLPEVHYGEWTAPWDGRSYTRLVAGLSQLLAEGFEALVSSEPATSERQ